eukprot:ANDGO_03635.mRNA.1 hypothetical protein
MSNSPMLDIIMASPAKILARERLERERKRRERNAQAKESGSPPPFEQDSDEENFFSPKPSPFTPKRTAVLRDRVLGSPEIRSLVKKMSSPFYSPEQVAHEVQDIQKLHNDVLAKNAALVHASTQGISILKNTFHAVRMCTMSELSQMASEMDHFQKVVSDLKETISTSRGMSVDHEEQVHRLTTRLTRSMAEKMEIMQQLSEKDMQIDELDRALGVLQEERDRLASDVQHMDNIRKDNTSLASQLTESQNKLKELETKYAAAKANIEKLLVELKLLVQSNKSLEKERDAEKQKSDTALKSFEESASSLAVLQQLSEKKDIEIASLSMQSEKVFKELDFEKTAREEAVSKLQVKMEECRSLDSEVVGLQFRVSELSKELLDAQTLIEELRSTVTDLEDIKRQQIVNLNRNADEIASLQQNLSSSHETIRELQDMQSSFRTQLQEADTLIKSTVAERDWLSQQLRVVESDAAQIRGAKSSVDSQLLAAQNDLQRVSADLIVAQSSAMEAQNKMAELQQRLDLAISDKAALVADNASLKAKISNGSDEMTVLLRQLSAARSQVEDLLHSSTSKTAETDALRLEISRIQAERDGLQMDVSVASSRILLLESNVQSLVSSENGLKECIQKGTADLLSSQASLLATQEALSNAESHMQEQSALAQCLQSQLAQQADLAAELRSQLGGAQEAHARTLTEKEQAISGLLLQTSDLKKQLADQTASCQENEKELKAAKIASAKIEKDTVKAKEAAEETVNGLRTENIALRASVTQLQDRLVALEAHCHALELRKPPTEYIPCLIPSLAAVAEDGSLPFSIAFALSLSVPAPELVGRSLMYAMPLFLRPMLLSGFS